MTGGCLGWEPGCLVWSHVMGNIFMPSGTYSYPGIPRAHTHTRTHSMSAPCPPTHTHTHPVMRWRGGGWKVKHFSNGTGSVGTVSTTHYNCLQHVDKTDRQLLWVGHSFGSQQGIHSPVHGPLICCFGMYILSGFHMFVTWHVPESIFCFLVNLS